MEKKGFFRQSEQLRTPQGWTGQAQALIVQLQRILNDLYQRLSRIGKKNLDNELLDMIQSPSWKEAKLLGSGDDLNNVTESGLYYITSGVSNTPASWAGMLVVRGRDDRDWYQLVFRETGVFVRSNSGSPATWKDWLSVAGLTYTAGTGLTLDNRQFKITQQNASDIINLLSEGTSDAQADDFLVAQYAGGGTTTKTYHRRAVKSVVNAARVKAALGTNTTHNNQFLRKDGTWQTALTSHQDISGKLNKAGDTMTGNLTLKSGAKIRYEGTAYGAGDILKVLDDGDQNGLGVVIGRGGLVVIGAGESQDAIASGKSAGTEDLYLGADGNVYLMSNVQNGIGTAKTFTFSSGGRLTIPNELYVNGQDMRKAIKNITRSGTTFTATCCDGTTFTFTQQDSNSWRGFQVKQYQTSYTVAAGSGKALTGTNFGVSTPSGYTPVAIAYFNTSDSNVHCFYLDARATGGSTVAYIRNNAGSSITNTMAIAILYLQN